MNEIQAKNIPVSAIIPNPRQPRTIFDEAALAELAASIAEHGVLQPIVVTENWGSYTLVSGERRLRAARLAGLAEIPAVIREVTDQQRLELALIENVQRSDLGALEKAEAYRQLVDDFGLTQEQVAASVGVSRPVVSNALRLLKLPGKAQDALRTGQITERQASSLLQLYELPEPLRKAAGEGSYPDIMPATIEARALAGASSDAVRADISRMIEAYGKAIPWNADKDVFAVPTGKPALCGECPAKLVRGVDTCGAPNCFAIRLRAYQSQRLIPPEPAPAPVAPTTPAERFAAARTALAPKPTQPDQSVDWTAPDPAENVVDPRYSGALPSGDDEDVTEPEKPAAEEQPAPVAPAQPPAALLAWNASTISLSVTYLPEDGDPRGRPCAVGLRANNSAPLLRMCRENEVLLSGFLVGLLDDLRAKFN